MSNGELQALRVDLDRIDDALVDLLAERTAIVHKVAAIKTQAGIPARLPDRIEQVVDRTVARARAAGADPALVNLLWRVMIEHFIALEEAEIAREPSNP